LVTRPTNEVMACFEGPSFQEGSGSVTAVFAAGGFAGGGVPQETNNTNPIADISTGLVIVFRLAYR
jgi:hypothetical protein